MLFCGTALYFFANIQRVAIPGTVFNLLQEQLHVSAPWITGLGSAFMYVYALNQLFIGLLVEHYGGRRLISWGALFFCVGSLLFPFASSIPALYAARILAGLGASTLYLSLVQETIRICPGNYNILLSVIIMAGYAGGITANAPFALCVNDYGLSAVLYVVGGATLFFYLLYLLVGTTFRKHSVRRTAKIRFSAFADVLRIRHNCDLFLFSGINFGLYYVLQTVIGKKFLEDYCNMESRTAAWVLSVMGGLSAISGFLLAVLSRISGNRRRVFCRISGGMSLGSFLVLALLLVCDIRTCWIAAVFCLLSTTASMSTITIPLLRETNSPPQANAAICFMNFSFYLSVAVFGNLTGCLMNLFPPELRNGILVYGRNSYLTVFAVLTFFSILVFRYSSRMKETMGKYSNLRNYVIKDSSVYSRVR